MTEEQMMVSQFNEINEPLRDKVAEQQMVASGLSFDVEELCIDQIQCNPATANYTRRDGTCSETVDSYAAAYARKDPMPMIVVINQGKHFTVLGGHHRLQGAQKANLKKLWCYVLSKNAESSAMRLSGRLNAFHGRGLSLRERLIMAMDMVQTDGLNKKDACMAMNISFQRYLQYEKQSHVDRLLRSHGVKPDGLQLKVKEQLSAVQDQAAVVQTAKTIMANKHITDEACVLIDQIKKAGNQWCKVIAEVQPIPQQSKAKGKAIKRPDVVRFVKYLEMLRTILQGKPTLQSVGFDTVSQETINLVKEVSNGLQRISHI